MSARAIIVAAGRGRRLGVETAEMPKCMVPVAGRPMLHWQLDALAGAGVTDVVVVRGYRGEHIDGGAHRLRFVDNVDWANNNILASLLCAESEFGGEGFFFAYSDIVYSPAVARALAAAAARATSDVSLVIDRRWRDTYVGRTLHPVPEAELALVVADPDGPSVRRVGKQAVEPDAAAGEFIGLARFSPSGADALLEVWRAALHGGGLEAPFGSAPALRSAYLTDALNAMAGAGRELQPIFIDGQWREIDTEQDLARAHEAVPGWYGER